MIKYIYVKPELEIVATNVKLLDTMPKDSKTYEEDPILGKETQWMEESKDDDLIHQRNLWDE